MMKLYSEPEEPAAKPKTGKSPIMNRLAQIKSTVTNKDNSKLQQRTESCPGPTPPSSPNGQRAGGASIDSANAESRKHSLPDPKNSNASSNATKNDKAKGAAAASSPKTKTRLFDSFRNPLKSKSTKLK